MKSWQSVQMASLLVGLVACSGGADKKEAKDGNVAETTPPPDEGSDDTQVAQAVPMALVGGDYVSQMSSRFGPSVAAAPAVDPKSTADANYPKASEILKRSRPVSYKMKVVLTAMQSFLLQIFGTEGYFLGKDVKIAKGLSERIFKLGADDSQFLVVRVEPEGAPYRFGVDQFQRAGDDSLVRVNSVDFTPNADASGAKVHYEAVVTNSDLSVTHVQTTYDTTDVSIAATFGDVPVSTGEAAKTAMRLDNDAAASSINVLGAYLWHRENASLSARSPRYDTTVTGDVELFGMRARQTGANEMAQTIAFIPGEEGKAVGFMPTAAVFKANDYPRLMRRFLVNLVRDPALNRDCATFGDTFRDAFQNMTVPAGVANAPANLCATVKTVADATVEDVIDETCNANLEVLVPEFKAAGASTIENVKVCANLFETTLLANPQYFAVAGGNRVLVQAPAKPTAEQVKVAEELAKVPPLDFSSLSVESWPAATSRPSGDFGAAEARPE